MANIKSAIKRIDLTKKQTLRNKAVKSELKTYIKKFEAAVEAGDFDAAQKLVPLLDKKLKKAAKKNVIHKNQAARKLSNLQVKLNKAQA